MHRLGLKLVLSVVVIFIATAIIIVPLYVWFQTEAYTRMEINNVGNFTDGLKSIEPFDREKIEAYYNGADVSFRIYVFDDEYNVLYSSYELGFRKNLIERLFSDKIDKFTEDAGPFFSKVENESAVRQYTTTYVNGKMYYINVKDSFSGVNKVFSFTNRILIFFVLLYIVICALVIVLAIRPSIRSIKETTGVASKIAVGDFSVRYKGRIRRDETGQLAQSVNRMADTIQTHITELNNYNFVLKEDNLRELEYEDMRKNVIRNITHDLKTPLAIISCQVEMMNSCEDQEKKDYYYRSAMEEIQKMSLMISEVLGMTLSERKKNADIPESVNVSEMISAFCKDSEGYLKANGLTLHTDIMSGLTLRTVKKHIAYVFDNYLSNAVYHTPAGGEIRITLREFNNAFRLSVFNSGDRIPDDMRGKIWIEAFTTKDEISEKNAGLGLYIVKEISLLEHTDCGFFNRPDGVEFWFDFIGLE